MDKYEKAKLGDLCQIIKGETGIASAEPGQYPLVTTGAERKTAKTFQFDAEAVCIPLVSSAGHGKKSLNYVHYQKGEFALGTILAAVIPHDSKKVSAAFLHRYLQFYKDRKIVPLMKGAANVSLAIKDIARIEIPVPPIEKQITFIDLFNRENGFNIELLSEFMDQSDLLSRLRQAILQEAIEGKLTADWRIKNPVRKGDPNTDASVLLAKIKAEKQKLIAEGKIKKEKPLAPIKPEEIPFELPKGWAWCRFDDIKALKDNSLKAGPFGSSLKKDSYVIDGCYKIYGQEQVIANDPNVGHYYIDEKKFKELKSCEVKPGDILISLVGTIGKLLILPDNIKSGIINPRLIKISLYPSINRMYISLLFKSPLVINSIKSMAHGGFMDVINLGMLKALLFPLPSLAEKAAIVERVDSLLAMVGELEKQVTERKTQAEELMQAVLREAFEGNNG